MADSKISGLDPQTYGTPVTTDEFVVQRGGTTNYRVEGVDVPKAIGFPITLPAGFVATIAQNTKPTSVEMAAFLDANYPEPFYDHDTNISTAAGSPNFIWYDTSDLYSSPSASPSATPSEGTPSATPSEGTPSASPSEGTPSASPSEGTPSDSPSASPSEGTPSASPSEGTPSSSPEEGTPSDSPSASPSEGTPSASPSEGTPSSSPTGGTHLDYPNTVAYMKKGSDIDWADARSGTADTLSTSIGTKQVGCTWDTTNYYIERLYARYSISEAQIEQNATVDAVRIYLSVSAQSGSPPIHIGKGTWAGSDADVQSEYASILGLTGDITSYGSVTVSSAEVKTITLNATGKAYVQTYINLNDASRTSSPLKFAIVEEYDQDNVTMSGPRNCSMAMNTTTYPRIEIDWS